ncbi:hypothetical protein RHMOL_Rhmol07G0149300 [Rhododendron molle]|uniref:Uncharacterized protein n=1 Tax=Rhododendron molle TaxID=49168 RepID=A0ACC0N283_RHOML|nr:hypothetical protein RHMOL_Rhmol07G0149300 [Rhododendron molle]
MSKTFLFIQLGMVLCNSMRSFVLYTSEQSDHTSDSLGLISAMNGSRSLIAEMRSE